MGPSRRGLRLPLQVRSRALADAGRRGHRQRARGGEERASKHQAEGAAGTCALCVYARSRRSGS
jgi:hypothetical protein